MQSRHVFLAAALSVSVACSTTSPTAPTPDLGAQAFPFPRQSALTADVPMQPVAPKLLKVTSGTLSTTSTSMGGSLRLQGARFEVSGDWTDGGSLACQPCMGGPATVWTSAAFSASRGSATVDGEHYESVYLVGVIAVAGTALVPAVQTSAFTVAFPFAMDESSFLTGYESDPSVGPARELFRLNLRGKGTGVMALNRIAVPDGTSVYTAHSLTYTF